MLAKCANPACSAVYRYLHEGRLFVLEPKRDAPKRGPPGVADNADRSHCPQYFWLCSSCCSNLIVQPDGDHGVKWCGKNEHHKRSSR
jgi:hypothetical protein